MCIMILEIAKIREFGHLSRLQICMAERERDRER